LHFDGRAEEALAFYERALGAKLDAKTRYADCPDPVPPEHMPPGGLQKLIHARLRLGEAVLMMGDGAPREGGGFRGFSLTLQYSAEANARSAFGALADGGQVLMPIGPTFFSPCYGILVDRFGVQWMVMVRTPQPV
jgi:PhnB protein